MEAWVPLFGIFLNSPTPEGEASLWFQKSFDSSTTTTTSTSSFLALLSKPTDVLVMDSSSSSSSATSSSSLHPKRVMFIQTLPNVVQSRILSFLTVENRRFCSRDLSALARNVLNGEKEVDFWVRRAAHNLLDAVSDSGFNWISSLSLGSSGGRGVEDEFQALPSWLRSTTNATEPLLSWLPLSRDELKSNAFGSDVADEISDENDVIEIEEVEGRRQDEGLDQVDMDIDSVSQVDVSLDPEILKTAASFKYQLLTFESAPKTVGFANGIRQLCYDNRGKGGGTSLAILGLIEPWEADDENASILISNLLGGSEENHSWPSKVLCSVILPKILVLRKPASRVLMTSTIEFCKLNQKSAVDALLLPLIFSKEGINTHICDVATRIIRECLHAAHVAAYCQKVLCGEKEARRFICLPCHQCLISDKLVWTEPLFTLFQNILNQNVYLTQDSVDYLASAVHELAERYSKSLKFGNFLLCFVNKCQSLLKAHKIMLIESVMHTNTFMTKSILSKLEGL